MPDSKPTPERESERLQLPLLTPTAQRMLSAADDSVRQNVAFLELVAVKDPVAYSKLLAMANSAFVSRPRPTQRIRDAILLLGTEVSFDVLLQSALLSALLADNPNVESALPMFLRKYMLSMTMTMRQLRKSVGLPFKPSSESTATFSALGVVACLFAVKSPDASLDALALCVTSSDFSIHKHVPLRPWIDQTSKVLAHWQFDKEALLQVELMTSELYSVYDGHQDGESASAETALAFCAQWLLSNDFSRVESDRHWLELPAARRCGFDKTNIAPSTLRMLVR